MFLTLQRCCFSCIRTVGIPIETIISEYVSVKVWNSFKLVKIEFFSENKHILVYVSNTDSTIKPLKKIDS